MYQVATGNRRCRSTSEWRSSMVRHEANGQSGERFFAAEGIGKSRSWAGVGVWRTRTPRVAAQRVSALPCRFWYTGSWNFSARSRPCSRRWSRSSRAVGSISGTARVFRPLPNSRTWAGWSRRTSPADMSITATAWRRSDGTAGGSPALRTARSGRTNATPRADRMAELFAELERDCDGIRNQAAHARDQLAEGKRPRGSLASASERHIANATRPDRRRPPAAGCRPACTFARTAGRSRPHAGPAPRRSRATGGPGAPSAGARCPSRPRGT